MPSTSGTGRFDLLAERIGELGRRVDAIEAHVEALDQAHDRFVSKVGDAQTTAGAVLARLDDLASLRETVMVIRETQAGLQARTSIMLGVLGVVGAAAVTAIVKYLAG